MSRLKNKYQLKILSIQSGVPEWLNTKSTQIKQFDVIISWDTEYRNKEFNIPLEQKTLNSYYNDIISHQICVYSKINDKYIEFIIYLYNDGKFNKRLSLGSLISITLEQLNLNWYFLKKNTPEIIILAHFIRAEYSTLPLDDRKFLDSKLTEIQKTFSSFKKFKWLIPSYKLLKEEAINVNLTWRDTILLAPESHKSLNKLSENMSHKKVLIKPDYYTNMVSLLEDDINLYEKYAITDCRVVLEYFTNLMYLVNNNNITGNQINNLPLTASGITVILFLKFLENKSLKEHKVKHYWHKKIFGLRDDSNLPINELRIDEQFANIAYLGGKNNISRFYHDYNVREKHELIVDIDIDSAYLRALSLLPIVNWEMRWKTTFNSGEFIINWAENFNESVNYTPIGFLNTKFSFKNDVYEPFLPQKTNWGLIYTKEGNTFATIPEVIESFKQGGIKSEYVKEVCLYDTIKDENGKVILAFSEYLSFINEQRRLYKKGSLENNFYKLLGNGFYGKQAQGIEQRHVFNFKGEKIPLKPSKITNSHYAAHCTSIIRVALTTLINEIENWPGCEVLNWTTDGLTFKMNWPKEKEYPNFKVNEQGIIIENQIEFKDLLPDLYEKLISNSIIKLLIKSSENIKTDKEWITIKTFGDRFGSEQTRGNWIEWKNITQGLARGNISKKTVENAEQFRHYSLSDDVQEVLIDTLVSSQEMKNNGWDLVKKLKIVKDKKDKFIKVEEMKRVINLGPDSKRKILDDGINTEAFDNAKEAVKERKLIEYIVRQKIRRKPERLVFEKKKREFRAEGEKSLRIQNSRLSTIIRVITSIILQKKLVKGITYNQITNYINEEFKINIKPNNLKQWTRRRVLIKSLPKNKIVENAINIIFKKLAIDSNKMIELEPYLV